MVSHSSKPLVGPFSVSEFESFLERDPPSTGIRLLLRKRKSTAPGIAWPEAVDVALCYGWIDGQGGSHDDDYSATSFTPRRARSMWSQVNREKVERLIKDGRMRPAGQAEIDRAKADGRWAAAYRMSTMEPDAQFQAALDANAEAKAFWETLGRTKRFTFLMRLLNMKRPATKTKRIHEYVVMLANGETLG